MAPTKKTTTAPKPKSSHPPYADMIKECIQSATEETRQGVSRPSIKKFLANHYKLDMSSAMNISNLNKAISRGAETGMFELPKGIGGRVKLVKKAKASANKENTPPKKAPAAKKPAAAAAAAAPKKAAATKAAPKKAAAKPAAAPKKAAPAKKTAAATKTKAAATGKTATKAAPKKRAAAKK